MVEHRLIRLDGSRIITTARARRYLSCNLSMIHDERKVPIFDMVSRRTVGTLDESFVVGWVHTGVIFITKGQLWRVLEIADGRLTVEPAKKRLVNCPHGRESRSRSRSRWHRKRGDAEDQGGRRNTPRRKRDRLCRRLPLGDGQEPVLIPTDQLITLENVDDGVVLQCLRRAQGERGARARDLRF